MAVLLWSVPVVAGPKKADFPLTVKLYKEYLGDVSQQNLDCFHSRYATDPNGSHIGCYESSNVDVKKYAVVFVNGQKHTYQIQIPSGEQLPMVLVNREPNQPQQPIDNQFPARMDGNKLTILASRAGKSVKVKALIIAESSEQVP